MSSSFDFYAQYDPNSSDHIFWPHRCPTCGRHLWTRVEGGIDCRGGVDDWHPSRRMDVVEDVPNTKRSPDLVCSLDDE